MLSAVIEIWTWNHRAKEAFEIYNKRYSFRNIIRAVYYIAFWEPSNANFRLVVYSAEKTLYT
jgi:hypothetical protein